MPEYTVQSAKPTTPHHPRSPKPGIVAWLRDRRIIAVAQTDEIAANVGSATYPGQVAIPLICRFPDLRAIEWIIDINLYTNPGADMCLGVPFNKKITGNVVGFTVVGMTGFAAGTTVFAEVLAIGPP